MDSRTLEISKLEIPSNFNQHFEFYTLFVGIYVPNTLNVRLISRKEYKIDSLDDKQDYVPLNVEIDMLRPLRDIYFQFKLSGVKKNPKKEGKFKKTVIGERTLHPREFALISDHEYNLLLSKSKKIKLAVTFTPYEKDKKRIMKELKLHIKFSEPLEFFDLQTGEVSFAKFFYSCKNLELKEGYNVPELYDLCTSKVCIEVCNWVKKHERFVNVIQITKSSSSYGMGEVKRGKYFFFESTVFYRRNSEQIIVENEDILEIQKQQKKGEGGDKDKDVEGNEEKKDEKDDDDDDDKGGDDYIYVESMKDKDDHSDMVNYL